MGEIRNLSRGEFKVILESQDPALLEALRGPKCDPGKRGEPGTNGLAGRDGKDGLDGAPGKSGGVGPKGDKGDKGDDGWIPTKEDIKALIREVLAGL